MNSTALDSAFAALQQYREGSGRGALVPIDEATAAAAGDPAQAENLEQRLTALLQTEVSALAKAYVCRKLAVMGSALSVQALAALLDKEDLAGEARAALQSMPCPEAGVALRDALSKTTGVRKIGLLNSLGMRRDADSIPVLASMLKDPDTAVAQAAAAALGGIGTPQAAEALNALPSDVSEALRSALSDARLACAERLLSAGRQNDALALYRSLTGSGFPKHVQLAANRGLLMVARKKR